jgi:hypothetical protein
MDNFPVPAKWKVFVASQQCGQLYYQVSGHKQVHCVLRPARLHSGTGSIPPEQCITVEKPDIVIQDEKNKFIQS